MARILIHAAYPLWRKNLLVGLARAKQLQDEGHKVTVTYCAAKAGTCACNQLGNPLVCSVCRFTTRRTAEKFGLDVVPLTIDKRSPPPVQVSVSQRKELIEGVLSGLISTFRILPPDIKRHRWLRLLKRRSYATSVRLLQAMKLRMQAECPARFEVFNGRHACSKFGLLAAGERGVPYNTLEITARRRAIIHVGHTAHDRMGIQNRILRQPVDLELAERFYAGRRRPRDNKFAKHQSRAFTLPSRDGFQRMVTVFLSSQDEFASLGKKWKSTFDREGAVLERLCKRFPETLFCVRFHPNQAGIKSDITSQFEAVSRLANVKMYYPTDQANTYDLIDNSEIVVVFNSTVAAEACWVGKPVIMIGPSFYDRLDIAYTPNDEPALWDLLAHGDLRPKQRENAARLASYMLKDGDDLKYVRVDNAQMTSNGPKRSLPWLTILARNLNDVVAGAVKPFV